MSTCKQLLGVYFQYLLTRLNSLAQYDVAVTVSLEVQSKSILTVKAKQ